MNLVIQTMNPVVISLKRKRKNSDRKIMIMIMMKMNLVVLLELLVEYGSISGREIFVQCTFIVLYFSYKESSSGEEMEVKGEMVNDVPIEEDNRDKIEKVCY